MTLQFLLDTNVLSEPMKASPEPRVVERLADAADRCATASVVWHELHFGMERLPEGARRRSYLEFLRHVVAREIPVLPYDSRAAEWHAEERARLESVGRTPPFEDGQIAAIAASNGLTLVTRNVRDFKRFHGLRVETWWR